MGQTYARSFLRSHISEFGGMMILEKSAEKATELNGQDLGSVHEIPEDCLRTDDLIILAFKPQDSTVLTEQLRPMVDALQVFLSIMAGIKMETIKNGLRVTKSFGRCQIYRLK